MADNEKNNKSSFFGNPVDTSKLRPLTDEEKAKQESDALTFKQQHPVKSAISGGITNIMDFMQGFTGLPLGASENSRARGYGELTQAGLPFAAYPAKGINKVFHGTKKAFEFFDPSKYDTNDVLGWLTHFAEAPEYSSQYAMGNIKGDYDGDLIPLIHESGNRSLIPRTARVIPAHIDAKNVLDLVDPNADDISQAVAFAENKEQLKDMFKRARTSVRDYKISPTFSHTAHEEAPIEEHPIRKIAESIKLSPETTENMPWDAIRYHDMDQKSWAVPRNTPMYSTFGKQGEIMGAPLNPIANEIPISPIRMIKDDQVSTGLFPVRMRDSANERINRLIKNGQYIDASDELDKMYNNEYINDDQYDNLSKKLYNAKEKIKKNPHYKGNKFEDLNLLPNNWKNHKWNNSTLNTPTPISADFKIGDKVKVGGTDIEEVIKNQTELDNVNDWHSKFNNVAKVNPNSANEVVKLEGNDIKIGNHKWSKSLVHDIWTTVNMISKLQKMHNSGEISTLEYNKALDALELLKKK